MKKVIVIVLLITVLSALLICGGVCLADDDSQTNYYYVDKANGSELSVMSSASRDSVVMQIPATYAFEYLEEQDEFIKIRYNSYEGYILKSDLNYYCKPVTSKWGDNPYFYTIPLKSSDDVITDRVALYQLNRTPPDDMPLKANVTINNVYGYYHNESGYYFLVKTTTMMYGNPITAIGYIKASDTNYSTFNKEDSIPTSAGYTEETKVVEPPTSSGDADSTITDSPDGNGNPSVPATNNFERYLLIAVIAVLCVVIIILIFAPNKSRRRQ